MKTICIYHSADLDGHCSGAIVKRAIPDAEMIGMNYGEEFPWDKVQEDDVRVVMVDFSFPPNDMYTVNTLADEFIWIDHHKTAIGDSELHGYAGLDGVREIGKAACELAWDYFFPQTARPPAVYALGRYDVWDHSDPRTLRFQYGMCLQEDTQPGAPIWEQLFGSNEFLTFFKLHDVGRTILQYQTQQNRLVAEAQAFETEIGGLKVIACNRRLSNSQLFDSVFDPAKHDAMLLFGWQAGAWCCSLYTTRKDVDVSKVAVQFGGGGHAGAAGFMVAALPFELR